MVYLNTESDYLNGLTVDHDPWSTTSAMQARVGSGSQTVPGYNPAVSELIQKCSEATVFVPNRELPLGYFCSVTPP
jgi:hypothetical protein